MCVWEGLPAVAKGPESPQYKLNNGFVKVLDSHRYESTNSFATTFWTYRTLPIRSRVGKVMIPAIVLEFWPGLFVEQLLTHKATTVTPRVTLKRVTLLILRTLHMYHGVHIKPCISFHIKGGVVYWIVLWYLATFWFGTFAMPFSATGYVVHHENTRRWMVGCYDSL